MCSYIKSRLKLNKQWWPKFCQVVLQYNNGNKWLMCCIFII